MGDEIRYRVMADNDLMQIYNGEEIGPLGLRLSPDTASLFAGAPEMKVRIAELGAELAEVRGQLAQDLGATCGCGLAIHPARIDHAAFHIADCPYAKTVGENAGKNVRIMQLETAFAAAAERARVEQAAAEEIISNLRAEIATQAERYERAIHALATDRRPADGRLEEERDQLRAEVVVGGGILGWEGI